MTDMEELKRAIKNGYDYYLDIADGSPNHLEIQKQLKENGYLLTNQFDYTMVYEKPNDHDTFNVRNKHRRYMEMIKPFLDENGCYKPL